MTKIIAELCQNHGGSRETLREMVEAAADSGADYAKIQTIFADDLTPRGRFEEGKIERNGVVKTVRRPYRPERDRLAELELTRAEHEYFIDICREHDITPITTVFSRKRIQMVASLPWPESVAKVASYDCASVPLLRELAESFDHLIVSTGATYDEEVENAAEVLSDLDVEYTLLHCVTNYPNTLKMCNLKRMEWLGQFGQSVGWSDHTAAADDGILATKVAIAHGADIVERHFTILDREQTKDGPISVTPAQLKELREFADQTQSEQVRFLEEADEVEMIMGRSDRELTHREVLNRDYYRGRFATYDTDTESWVYNWEESETNWE